MANISLRNQLDHPERIQILYHSNWWDGMLSGAIKYKNKRYWVNCDIDEHHYRIFGIYDLTEEEWKEEDYWHNLFEKYVGEHTKHNERNNRVKAELKDYKDHHKFYDSAKERKEKDLKSKIPIGYYDDWEFKFRKSPHRNYFIHEESRESIHVNHHRYCDMYRWIKWRNDANKFHGEEDDDINFDQGYEGWAMKVVDVNSTYWLAIKYCPWCNTKLPKTFKPKGELE